MLALVSGCRSGVKRARISPLQFWVESPKARDPYIQVRDTCPRIIELTAMANEAKAADRQGAPTRHVIEYAGPLTSTPTSLRA
jgi:hypothetical protein